MERETKYQIYIAFIPKKATKILTQSTLIVPSYMKCYSRTASEVQGLATEWMSKYPNMALGGITAKHGLVMVA